MILPDLTNPHLSKVRRTGHTHPGTHFVNKSPNVPRHICHHHIMFTCVLEPYKLYTRLRHGFHRTCPPTLSYVPHTVQSTLQVGLSEHWTTLYWFYPEGYVPLMQVNHCVCPYTIDSNNPHIRYSTSRLLGSG